MSNRRLLQSQDGQARGNPWGWHTAQPADARSEARQGAKSQPQLLPCSCRHGPQTSGLAPTARLHAEPFPDSNVHTVPRPPCSRPRLHVCNHPQKPPPHTHTQHGLPLTPPKCHTNIYTQPHPHTDTHQLRLHRHPHQHSPGLSPTQTAELGNN